MMRFVVLLMLMVSLIDSVIVIDKVSAGRVRLRRKYIIFFAGYL